MARKKRGKKTVGSRRVRIGEIRRVFGKARRLLDELEAVLLDRSGANAGRVKTIKPVGRRLGKVKAGGLKSRGRRKAKKCSRRGCGRPAKARGLCNAHYVTAFRMGNLKNYPKVTKVKEE